MKLYQESKKKRLKKADNPSIEVLNHSVENENSTNQDNLETINKSNADMINVENNNRTMVYNLLGGISVDDLINIKSEKLEVFNQNLNTIDH